MIVSVKLEPTDFLVDEAPFDPRDVWRGDLESAELAAQMQADAAADRLHMRVEWELLDHSESVDPHCAQGRCRAPVILRGFATPELLEA